MTLQDETLRLKFDNSYNGRLFAVQGDTGRTYNLQILSDMNNVLDITGMALRLYIGNDKEVSYTDGEITQAEEGKFKVQVYNSQLKYPGLQKAQFVLTDKDGQKVGSKVFDLYIEEGLETGTSLGKNILVDFETIDETLRLLKNYDKTLEEVKEVDASLKVGINEGIEARNNLADCKKKALEIKDQLDTSTTDAGKTLQDLKTTKAESETLNAGLSSENTKASDNIRTLSTSKSNLDASIEKAVQTDAALKGTDTEAKATEGLLRGLLAQIGVTEEKVENLIASGDLSKYITDPKLQEALKAYATKEDLESIDVTDQLKDYAKKTDLDDKVDKVDGKSLSSNDYTDEDKKQVGSIPDYLKKTELQDELKRKSINYMAVAPLKISSSAPHPFTKERPFYYFARHIYEKILDLDSQKINVTDITNNLTSTSTANPLSANQGKVLNDTKVDKDKIQILTESEYNSLSTKDVNTLYFLK